MLHEASKLNDPSRFKRKKIYSVGVTGIKRRYDIEIEVEIEIEGEEKHLILCGWKEGKSGAPCLLC